MDESERIARQEATAKQEALAIITAVYCDDAESVKGILDDSPQPYIAMRQLGVATINAWLACIV
jgi:hypothetical protein